MTDRRLALITGGTSGIGYGAARHLIADYDLALAYASDHAKAQVAQSELKAMAPAGARIEIFARPLESEQDTRSLYSEVVEKFHGTTPSVLVNSAGRVRDSLFAEGRFEDVQATLNEHLSVAMALAQLVVKPMMREKFGRIVNLSSISAAYAKRGQAAYAAAKAGLEGFTRTLALEVAHRGVTVNAIAPGLIETPMTKELLTKIGDDPRELKRRIPAGYAGSIDDVGTLVAYLCSPDARYLTGQVLTIDGGRSLGDPLS